MTPAGVNPERGDHTDVPDRPIGRRMDAASLILAHCFALGLEDQRPSARLRLEAALGHDFAEQLVTALTLHSSR